MWNLPTALRAKMALVTLLGIFFIPMATSDLRGLSHVLTCEDSVSASLFVSTVDTEQGAELLSADSVEAEDVGLGLCGGLEVGLELQSKRADRADIGVVITNTTDTDWRGTVTLQVDGTRVPVAIGRVAHGSSEADTVQLRIKPGKDYEISGTLMIGP